MQACVTGIGWIIAAGLGHGRGPDPFASLNRDANVPARREVFQDSDNRFGRMDAFSKLGLAAMTMALRDAGLETTPTKRHVGIVAATQRGCLATDMDYYATVLADQGQWPSPHLFTYTLPSCVLGEAALRFGLTGPTYVIHDDQRFPLTCIRAALLEMADGEADVMLAGVCDASCPPGFDAISLGCVHARAVALFVVLEAVSRPETSPYALIRDEAESLLVNDVAVRSLEEMIRLCLKK